MFEFKPEKPIPSKFQPTSWPKGRLTELLGDARKNPDNQPKAEAKDSKPQNKPVEAKAEQPARDDQNKQQDAKTADASLQDEENTAKEPAKLEQTGYRPPQAFAPKVAAGALSMVQLKAAMPPKDKDDSANYRQGDEFKLGKGGYAQKKRLEDDRQETASENDSASRQSDRMMQDYAQLQQQQQWQRIEQQVFAQTFESFIADETNRLNLEAQQHEENIDRLNKELEIAEADRDAAATALETTRGKIAENNTTIAATNAAIASTEEDLAKLRAAAGRNAQEIKAQEAVVADGRTAVANAAAVAQDEAANAHAQQEVAQTMTIGTEEYVKLAKKTRIDAEQLKQEIEKAETNLLKDEKGQPVHQDEKGNFYSLDADGKKQEYSAEEQKKLKENLEKEGLVTADTLDKMRKDHDQLLSHAKVYESAAGWTQSEKGKALDSAERSRIASAVYTKVASDLETELEKHQNKLSTLQDEGRKIQQELTEKATVLESLKEKLAKAEATGAQLTKEEKAQLEDLTKKEQRVKDINTELAAETTALIKTEKDAAALETANEKYKSPEMQARLNSSDPTVQKAAREELLNSLPPDMRIRVKKEWQTNLELAKQQKAQASPSVTETPNVDNTSRPTGSATPSGINTSAQNVTAQYNAASAGTTAPANETAPAADQEMIYANSAPKTTASGMHP